MTQRDFAGTDNVQAGIESVRRMAVRFRLTVLVLTFVVFFGLILHNVVPYTPTFPIVLLANSLICAIAGTQANRIVRGSPPGGFAAGLAYAGGLAYTAIVGGGIMFLFSALGASFGPGRSGHEKPWGNPVLLFTLSWPAVVICLVSIGIGITAFRRIKKLSR